MSQARQRKQVAGGAGEQLANNVNSEKLQETMEALEVEIHRRLVDQLAMKAQRGQVTSEQQETIEKLYFDLKFINPELAFATLQASAALEKEYAQRRGAPPQQRQQQHQQQYQQHYQPHQQQQYQQQQQQQTQSRSSSSRVNRDSDSRYNNLAASKSASRSHIHNSPPSSSSSKSSSRPSGAVSSSSSSKSHSSSAAQGSSSSSRQPPSSSSSSSKQSSSRGISTSNRYGSSRTNY